MHHPSPALLLSLLLACDGSSPAPQIPAGPEVPAAAGESILLARHTASLVGVTLPAASREGAVPERLLPLGGWQEQAPAPEGTRLYVGDSPLLTPLSPLPEGFGVVDGAGERLPRGQGRAGTWGASGEQVVLWLPPEADVRDYALVHAGTTAQLRGLSRASSGAETDVAFMVRSERLKQSRRHGVFLPAPAEATWRVHLPAGAPRLMADAAMMVSPLRSDPASDGSTLVVEVLAEDGAAPAQEVARVAVGAGKWEDVEADLSAWAGQVVHLRLRSEPGASALSDYLLVGEPLVYVPRADPRRVVLIFVDTLRADHMGLYGYARDTTPNLDAWAADAAVFTEVRSVAPWTYPSARAILSGRPPDRWEDGPILPERLAEAGWITTAFVNNAYLSSVFGMERGWSWHFYSPDWGAEQIIGGAMSALQKTPDRDLVLLLQFMDVHLPYAEPEPYRTHWIAGELPGLSDPILRDQVLGWSSPDATRAELGRYLSDRYDQSLRYLDRRLVPLLQALDENDVVIFFGDHGEEFLEHGGLEHGHSLHDELMHVPLLVRAPGVTPGRIATPASLLDLTPTVLDLVGLPADASLSGQSLLHADASAPRAQGLGYILHGDDAWGVVTPDHHKWILSGTEARDYDLTADPGEQQPQLLPLAAGAEATAPAFVQALSAALERPVVSTWRALLPETYGDRPRAVRISAEGGLAETWASQESPNLTPPRILSEADGSVRILAGEGRSSPLPRELFARPRVPGAAVVFQAEDGTPLASAEVWAPLPAEERLKTSDEAVRDALEALGYLSPAP